MVTIFDLPAAPPFVALVSLALLGFLALALYSGVRVAVQSMLLLGGLVLIGAALGWAVWAVVAWVTDNPQMSIGLAVGFGVGLAMSTAALVVLRAARDGDQEEEE